MRKNMRVFSLVLLLFINNQSFSAITDSLSFTIEELKVDDKFPDDIIFEMYNSETITESAKSFRGKWLILDFWESYCAACINSMPKNSELMKKYADNMELIMVTKSNRSNLEKFINGNPVAKETDLSFIVNDTILSKLFPHRIIPHVVWINPEGNIKAITSGDDLTEENFLQMVSNEKNKMHTKKDDINWDYRIPLGGQKSDDIRTLRRSVLKEYDPSIGSVCSFRPFGTVLNSGLYNHVYFSNMIPIEMFYNAFMIREGAPGNVNPYRIINQVKNPEISKKYVNKELDIPYFPTTFPYMEWENYSSYAKDINFSYDFIARQGMEVEDFSNVVIEDLNHYFPIKGTIEKREQLCLVIYKKDNFADDLLKPKTLDKIYKVDDEKIHIANYKFDDFIEEMKHFNALPIIDETGIETDIDLIIDFSESSFLNRNMGLIVNMLDFDYEVFKKQLNKYGLDFQKKMRTIDMLVIYD